MMSPPTTPVVPPSPEARRRLRQVRQRDTAEEVAVRRALFARGLRYRVQVPVLLRPRRVADLVFQGPRVAVFVDGCFWHGCPEHATWPKNNAEFWRAKIEANRARDSDTDARLAGIGWTVFRVWAHEEPEQAATRIDQVVRARQARRRVS